MGMGGEMDVLTSEPINILKVFWNKMCFSYSYCFSLCPACWTLHSRWINVNYLQFCTCTTWLSFNMSAHVFLSTIWLLEHIWWCTCSSSPGMRSGQIYDFKWLDTCLSVLGCTLFFIAGGFLFLTGTVVVCAGCLNKLEGALGICGPTVVSSAKEAPFDLLVQSGSSGLALPFLGCDLWSRWFELLFPAELLLLIVQYLLSKIWVIWTYLFLLILVWMCSRQHSAW